MIRALLSNIDETFLHADLSESVHRKEQERGE